jgi:hypothetical protein
MSGRRVLRARLLAVLGAMLLFGLLAGPVRAADVEFGEPATDATFGEQIEFRQPVTLGADATRVEVRLTFSDAAGPLVVELPIPLDAGSETLRYAFEFAEGGHLLPNTRIEASWRVYTADHPAGVDGPSAAVTYVDDRFEWQTVSGELVRVHWYEGGAAFGQRALDIGETAVRDTAELLGVTEDAPVDFFVYASEDEFRGALGPGTRENVGGQANAGIRTLFALITPSEIDQPWVEVVVPHELVHLVFDTAVKNPYHFPPRWLNEGLAVYLSEGYTPGDRQATERAASAGTLIPLDGLAGQFPTSADAFRLAYSESASAVDYLIRTYGPDALVGLIRSYADGRTDDEAFRDALGVDVAGFGEGWMDELGAVRPERFGPQPVPAGPQPPGWQGVAASPGPGAPAGTPSPAATDAPTAPAEPSSGGVDAVLVAVLVGLVVVAAVAVLVARRRRRTA